MLDVRHVSPALRAHFICSQHEDVELALNRCAEACVIHNPTIREMFEYRDAFEALGALKPGPGEMFTLLRQAKIPGGSYESMGR